MAALLIIWENKQLKKNTIKINNNNVIDTTGCGDSYHAGFLCSYLRDRDIINAMNEGSRVASKTLSHIGGF